MLKLSTGCPHTFFLFFGKGGREQDSKHSEMFIIYWFQELNSEIGLNSESCHEQKEHIFNMELRIFC